MSVSPPSGTPQPSAPSREAALSEAVYRDCFDLSPAAQVILNHRGELLDLNLQACTVMGHERAVLLGRRLTDVVHADDRAEIFSAIEHSTEHKVPFELECRVQSPGQALRWFLVQSRPAGQPGQGTLWYTLLADITERKRQEAWLTHRNALLTALSHNLPGMIYVFRPGMDKGGRLDFVSEGVRHLFGATPEEALASPWVLYNRVPPEDLSNFFQQRDQAIGEASRLHSEFRVRNAEGELRWCAADSVAGLDADGNEVRCGYIADITEHKLYQEACMAAETAERASRAKSQFLSRMSHELRTPLNAVIGFAQLLQMDKSPELADSQRQKVELIERSGAHLLDVISDVLDLSRIEAGDMPLSVEPIMLGGVINDAQAMVAEAAGRANVLMTESGRSWDMYVMADRVRLRQVLVNLLSNAVKYNRPGGEVCVAVSMESDTRVLLEVTDTGVGLSESQITHLFEPFNRLGAEHSGVEGTGIGLVIVHRLVELMGGTIAVRSQAGQGTTFSLSLPAAEVDLASDHGVLDEALPEARQATILYAEDNEINVLLVRQILELRPSWKLEVARSGAEALKLVNQIQPDLLLLDMHLGDMTGFELAELLDQNPALQGVTKVALSADAMPDRVHAARTKGFSAYLTKPLDVAALLRCLDEHLAAK
ncbi:PAS domain-containing hybrid sensor histidine kinase/response regulator [Aquabacterium sp. NJ1]|uniref:hybrid sensor histidine kinase/response regulator n=1 Tax=Aquabacterium sp. NJ1 TaxID=1538295 RepID=UPI0009DCF8E4|nr:PAS domain-containing hybrid sensor histidine kinase/response regulator [Aquabacterium sp. NJ1]